MGFLLDELPRTGGVPRVRHPLATTATVFSVKVEHFFYKTDSGSAHQTKLL